MKLKSYILVGYLISSLLTIYSFSGSPANVDCKKRDLFPSWNDIDC